MKTLLKTTAIVALMAGPVFSQTATPDPAPGMTIAQVPVAEVIGDPVFIDGVDGPMEVGSASDVLLSANGVIAGVIVDIGGASGLTPKTIAIDAQAFSMVPNADTSEQQLTLTGVDLAGIEAASPYDAQAMTDAGLVQLSQLEADPSPPAVAQQVAPAEALETDAAPLASEEGAPQSFVAVSAEMVTPETLQDAEVFDTNDEQISDVSQVTVSETGAVDAVVFKVGGFLGFGGKEVAVPVEDVQIMRDPAGDTMRVYLNASLEALKGLPAFNG